MRPRHCSVVVLTSALALAACQRAPAPQTPAANPATPPPVAAAHGHARNAFTVEVSLSKAAQARMGGKERVIVSADYFGYPSQAAIDRKVPGSEDPWLTLHRQQIELAGAGTASFPQVTFDATQLAWIEHPDQPEVNINVFSGRKSSPDNLLDCQMFQDTLDAATKSPIRLHCTLIGESK